MKGLLRQSLRPTGISSGRRVGILGGTFNPVHVGHLAIAQWAAEKLRLDKLIFVPCSAPPHKTSKGVIAAEHRLQMVKLAIAGNPKFDVSDFEIKRGGRSYSIDTVKYFRESLPRQTKIYFIVGGDAVPGLKKWQRIDEILRMATMVAINRKGFEKRRSEYPVKWLTMPEIDISSSKIRRQIRAGENITYLVPQKLLAYILKQKLYM
jgi:nicotinate-nucleotide adenylyltransferase